MRLSTVHRLWWITGAPRALAVTLGDMARLHPPSIICSLIRLNLDTLLGKAWQCWLGSAAPLLIGPRAWIDAAVRKGEGTPNRRISTR